MCCVAPDAIPRFTCVDSSGVAGVGGDSGKKFKRLRLVSVLGSCLFNVVKIGLRSFTLFVIIKKATISSKTSTKCLRKGGMGVMWEGRCSSMYRGTSLEVLLLTTSSGAAFFTYFVIILNKE